MINPIVGAALIGGGAGLLGGGKSKKGGSGGSSAGVDAAARLQAEIARDLWTTTQPLRDILFTGTPARVTGGLPANYTSRLDEINQILSSGLMPVEFEERERSED